MSDNSASLLTLMAIGSFERSMLNIEINSAGPK